MRLRRLEFVIIGVTLAFVFFTGGFFTGRNFNSVNITSVATQNGGTSSTTGNNQLQQLGTESDPGTSSNSAGTANQTNQGQDPSEDTGNNVSVQTPESPGTPRGDGRININLASQSELTDLPGIGSVLASRIIDYRRQHGDFLRIEDLRNVSGIGEKRYEAIEDKITVG